jgi:E3 ubiquitin-protein ligase RNF1/2
VSHLSKYLSTRLCVENSPSPVNNSKQPNSDTQDNFFIYVNPINTTTSSSSSNSYQLLTGTTTLEQIIEKFWKQNKPLELHYNYRATSTSTASSN